MNVQRCMTVALVLGSVALSAAFLGRAAFWVMYPEAVDIPVPEAKAPVRSAPAAQKNAPSFDLRQMEALNLFGARVSAQAPLPGSEEAGVDISEDEAGALPVSRRGFELLGTIVHAEGQSRAVISAGKDEKTYLEGEKVKDWTLVKVLRRVVILEKDGLRERLPFKEESKRAARASAGVSVLVIDPGAESESVYLGERELKDLPLLRVLGVVSVSRRHRHGGVGVVIPTNVCNDAAKVKVGKPFNYLCHPCLFFFKSEIVVMIIAVNDLQRTVIFVDNILHSASSYVRVSSVNYSLSRYSLISISASFALLNLPFVLSKYWILLRSIKINWLLGVLPSASEMYISLRRRSSESLTFTSG